MTAERVLVYGNFINFHTGHFRFLKFASELGSELYVGLNAEQKQNDQINIILNLISQFKFVHKVEVFSDLETFIRKIRPNVVVKGSEFRTEANSEQELIEELGGRLIFSSGDFHINQADLNAGDEVSLDHIKFRVKNLFHKQINVDSNELCAAIQQFQNLNIAVIGDLIVDRYTSCKPIGMSQEDSLVVHVPTREEDYVGGAGIVAAHCAQLGARTTFVTALGNDDTSAWACEELTKFGVETLAVLDESRITTLKTRFRSAERNVFRVSKFNNYALENSKRLSLIKHVSEKMQSFDAIIFSDFSYGILDEETTSILIAEAKRQGTFISADSQTSSQIGRLSKFKGCNLVTPTEREARIELRNEVDGLAVVANELRDYMNCANVVLKLGADGILIDSGKDKNFSGVPQRIESLNLNPIDVSGAGDSLLACTTLSLAQGRSLKEAGILGSLSAAIQISREGNQPIRKQDLIDLLN
jgi:rfaE bifunctional protein kinase chain/domain